jgi:hypothetical protein
VSWAAREPDEELEDWMLRVQISLIAAWHQPARRPGLAFVTQGGGPPGWVVFRHYLPDAYAAPGDPS